VIHSDSRDLYTPRHTPAARRFREDLWAQVKPHLDVAGYRSIRELTEASGISRNKVIAGVFWGVSTGRAEERFRPGSVFRLRVEA
jgi:hypothetical protein